MDVSHKGSIDPFTRIVSFTNSITGATKNAEPRMDVSHKGSVNLLVKFITKKRINQSTTKIRLYTQIPCRTDVSTSPYPNKCTIIYPNKSTTP